jgi:hypothetical protein
MRRPRKYWTPAELKIVRRDYANHLTCDIAAALGRTASSVYQQARLMGLRKSAAFLASPAAGRLSAENAAERGAASRFQKGHATWNKGMPGWSAAGTERTRFTKGHRPQTWRPIGSERITVDGLLERKVTDTGYPPRDWVGIHRLVWQDSHGPIPSGYIVVFKPGHHSTVAAEITAETVEIITRAELMLRNTVHNWPKELAQIVQLRGAIHRQINRREKSLAE